MDPEQTLAELREMVTRVNDGTGRVDVDEFAEKFDALDTWLSKGGFLPGGWSQR